MGIFDTGGNILLIILGFGLLIALHELGHFLAARWAGIRADGFAIGMGPVIASYRGGVGFRFGSCDEVVKSRLGRLPIQLSDSELKENGLGETEYSLRMLPIGGYVKMLGQEDGRPGAVSEDPRSYGKTPVGKRMVVVSAGVIMNLITAVAMFVIAFMVGVRFEAPIVGTVGTDSPASLATPISADASEGRDAITAGLQPGDRIMSIDGKSVLTFSDLLIESAMSVPGDSLLLEVERPGVKTPLEFDVMPERDPTANMRLIGVSPAMSGRLSTDPRLQDALVTALKDPGAGDLRGRILQAVDGASVETWAAFETRLAAAAGRTVPVVFGPTIEDPTAPPLTIEMSATPLFETMPLPDGAGTAYGLLGLAPLVRISDVPAGGRNVDVLEPGDVVLRVADIHGPRMDQFRAAIQARPLQALPMLLMRDGREVEVEVSVDANGLIGVLPDYALDLPITATPLTLIDGESPRPTPIAGLDLLPRTRIDSIGGSPVTDWASLRSAITSVAEAQNESKESIEIGWTLPIEGSTPERGNIEISTQDRMNIANLGWTAPLPPNWFEPLQVTLTANGNPITAITMGFRQTWKMIVLTYLTIDRLIGGSVSVKELRGPVGIVDIGTQVADRGIMYLLFFLAMISVNLAVLNFLPLPIVDGGLFLFLVYEKIRGRPPSIAFQNVAALVGLALIGTLFVVTFYNDVMRLAGGG